LNQSAIGDRDDYAHKNALPSTFAGVLAVGGFGATLFRHYQQLLLSKIGKLPISTEFDVALSKPILE